MKKSKSFITIIASAILLPAAVVATIAIAQEYGKIPSRPEGPCDIYARGGAPCVAAHSSTRALYANYNGPLYQVMRQSDGKTLDIGVVQPSAGDAGGYADAAAQDRFCADTYCWITILYDQSDKGNDLYQAPRGGFSGTAMGGFNSIPVADWAPVTVMGHKVYGVFIASGMGLRWNDTKGVAVDDQAEGQYWVINGHHYDDLCCFDYGNAETDSRDDGDGTMETTYYGNEKTWYYGSGDGPWIQTDQENNIVGCANDDPNDKYCPDVPSIAWRFVTATADGEPHHWRTMGGDAQTGDLQIIYDGRRVPNERSSYDPMRKQGAILLGNGGDNGNGSAGTFYEGAMTAAGTFPSAETNQELQANIVAAKYDVQRLSITGASNKTLPNGLQTFAPRTTKSSNVTFYNNTGETINDLTLSVDVPKGWKINVLGSSDKSKKVGYEVAPGQTVVATFSITSSGRAYNGDMVAKAAWTSAAGKAMTETSAEKVRNVEPVTINEFRISDDKGNATNSFIELYNASDDAVDISGWTLTHHAINMPHFSDIKIPSGTKLDAKGFYLLGLSNSGLAVQADKGDKTIYVRDVNGISVGDEIEIGTGKNVEKHKVAKVVSPVAQQQSEDPMARRRQAPVGFSTPLWQPLPDGPVITIPAGSTNIPVTSTAGFEVGQKMAIGYGATYPDVGTAKEKYEVVTITEVGKPGTQAYLSMPAKVGDTNIKVSSVANISVGDKIRLDIEAEGYGIETVTVKSVGTASARSTFMSPLGDDEDPGTGLELMEPLKFNHASNMPFSVRGTGISFEPASKYDHSSNEPVLALVYALELEQPLAKSHDINDVVFDAKVSSAGYQDDVAADQLFGGPVLTSTTGITSYYNTSGNMVLRDDKGNIVDGINYGRVVDPWLSEGYHGEPGKGQPQYGSFVSVPNSSNSNPAGNYSMGRYPDGVDTDSNKYDFYSQNAVSVVVAAPAGSNNLKIASVKGLKLSQPVYIGSGDNIEKVIVANIGTVGGTTLAEDVKAGSNTVKVASSQRFSVGQEIVIGEGADAQTMTIASITPAPRRRGGFGMPAAGPMPSDTIVLTASVKKAHKAGSVFAGTGITLASPLKNNHPSGDVLISDQPTPKRPNRF